MRRTTMLLALAALVVGLFTSVASHAACNDANTTEAGTQKCEPEYSIKCGTEGQTPASAGGVRTYANQTADGGEVEACNDQGAGTTRGALIVKVDTDDRYVRVSLESTKEQEPNVDPGYINVQAGPGAEQTGIWCSKTDGSGTGYSRPKSSPGEEGGTTPDQWVECIPGN